MFFNSGIIGKTILRKFNGAGPRKEIKANKVFSAIVEEPDLGAFNSPFMFQTKKKTQNKTWARSHAKPWQELGLFFF